MSSVQQSMWEHRHQGKPLAALNQLLGRRKSGFEKHAANELLDHFVGRPAASPNHTGRPCLLLETARHHLQARLDPLGSSTASLDPFDLSRYEHLLKLLPEPQRAWFRERFSLRCDLIRLIRDLPGESTERVSQLASIVARYDQVFSPPSTPGVQPPGVLPQPAQGNPWWQTILEQQFPNWGALFDELAASLIGKRSVPADGWSTGLCFVGETVAWLLGAVDVPSSHFARASVLLVGSLDTANPRDGHLAELVVEAFPGGSGRVTPHPLYAGYLATDERFSGSLALAARELLRHAPGCQHDFRWTIRVHDPRDEARLSLPMNLSDASAGAAIYCALRAALEGDRLDERSVVTAALLDTGYDARKRPRPVGLTPIGGLLEKVTALREEVHLAPGQRRDPFRNERIDRILVAPDQPWDGDQIPAAGVETRLHEWKVQIAPVNDLEQFYRFLTEYGRKVLALKRALADRAQSLLAGLCQRYVPPRFGRLPTDQEAQFDRERNPQRKKPLLYRLSDQQRDRLLVGLWTGPVGGPAPRIAILADSGIGKSSLLLEAELRIASDESDLRVPLRYGAGPIATSRQLGTGLPVMGPPLTSIDWTQPVARVLKNLASQILSTLPKQVHVTVKDLLAMKKRGDLVILLDSTDQTNGDFKLNQFLTSVPKCAVLVTGRRETPKTRITAYSSTNWQWVHLRLFSKVDVRDFCRGRPGLARFLIGRKDLHGLIRVPVLLRQIRELGRDTIQNLKNREAVYAATLNKLLEQSHRSAHQTENAALSQRSQAELTRQLAHLAWEMWRVTTSTGKEFTGFLADETLERFCHDNPEARALLQRLNLVTEAGYLDQYHSRQTNQIESVAWRHFSFWEWFCGLHLAELAKAETNWGDTTPGPAEQFFQEHARERYGWVIRFALSAAHRLFSKAVEDGRTIDAVRWNDAVCRMARWLIAYGNPFLLTEAVEQDRIPLAEIDENLDRFRQYLVFLEQFDGDWDGSKAEQASWPEPPDVDVEIAACLVRMFALERNDANEKDKASEKYKPLYRDGRWLPMAVRLLDQTIGPARPDAGASVAPPHSAGSVSSTSPLTPPHLDFALKTDFVTPADVLRFAEGELSAADLCRALRDQFLSEFENRVVSYPQEESDTVKRKWLEANRALLQLVPEDCRPDLGLPFSLPRVAAASKQRDVTPMTVQDLTKIRTWPAEGDANAHEPVRVPETLGEARERRYRARRDEFNGRLKEYAVDWCQCPPPAWEHPYDADRDPAACTVRGVKSPPDRRLPDGYWLGRTPVTNAQWETFDPHHRRTRRMEWSRSIPDPNDATKFLFQDDLDDHPVIQVSWFDAMLFCRWLTGRGTFGRFQLPNDWEWEACARAGRDRTTDEFGIPWTDQDGQEHFDSLSSREANFNGEYPEGKAPKGLSLNGTCPAGGIPGAEYPANGFGLVDMHGQVGEWQRNPYESPETARDPEHISMRCSVRGCDWGRVHPKYCRCSFRGRDVAGDRSYDLSLRVARTCPFTL